MSFCPRCAAVLEKRAIDGRERKACPAEGCGYVFWNNPVPVVAAIVEWRPRPEDAEEEVRVVLVRNKGWPATWFGLVSGFLEKGETPAQGVLREVKEELDLDAEVVGFVGPYAFFQMNQLILVYHVRACGDVALGDELADVKYVPPDKLRPWPMGTGEAVRDWLAARRGPQEPARAPDRG